MNPGSYLICWVLAALAALAPLPFGSVRPVPLAALQIALLAMAMAWITMRRRSGLATLPWRDPVLVAGGALALFGLAQMAPLPAGLVEVLSPAAAAVQTTYAPAAPGWIPISIEPYATWRSVLSIACWTLAVLMVRHNAVDLKGRLIVAGGVVAGGIFQAGYGLFEFISGRQHIFGYRKEHFTDVATGTFISRNNYAGYLEMAIPLALALGILCLGRGGDREDRRPRLSLKRRLAATTGRRLFPALLIMMGAFLMATAILMSRSRMGIVSIAVALTAGGLAMGTQGRTRRFAAASVAVALLVAVFATQIDILPVVNRFHALDYEFSGGYGRLRVWTQALPMLAAYPLLGSGLGTWEDAFSPWRDDATQVRVDFAHNDYLEFGAEAGLIGALVLVGGAALAMRQHASKALRSLLPQDEIGIAAGAGLLAIALHSATDFHLSIPADALVVTLLIGLYLRRTGPAAPADRSRGRARIGGWAVTSAVLVALGLGAASPAAARMATPQPSAAPAGDETDDVDAGVPAALDISPDQDLCSACLFEPLSGARRIEAASRLRKRLLKDVEAILTAQMMGQPADPLVRKYLAGRIDQAIALVDEGLALAPASGKGHFEAGMLHFGRFALVGLPPQASDDFDQACASFARALALQPWRAASHRKVARIMAPFWEEAGEGHRAFIEKTVARAHAIDPAAEDITQAHARMGI